MNAYNPPVRLPTPEADSVEEALAHFRSQWPPERCKVLGDAICGTPAQKAAANTKLVARALEARADDTASDAAVRELVKGHKAFERGGLS